MSRTSDSPLRARIRANVCPFSGLSPANLERHVLAVERMVNQARARQKTAHRRKLA